MTIRRVHILVVLIAIVLAAPASSQTLPPASPTARESIADRPVDVAALLNDLGGPDAEVRLAAGKKLLEHSHQLPERANAIAEAIALVNPLDTESDVRRYGRRALLRIGNAAMPAAIVHLSEDDELLAALAEPGDTASIEPLIAALAANKAISRDADGWPEQTGVKTALLLIGPENIAAPLVAALERDCESFALLAAIQQLAGPQFAAAAPLLAELLASDDEQRGLLAADALAQIGDAALVEVAKALKDPKRRGAALYAAYRLGPQAAPLAETLFELATIETLETNGALVSKFGGGWHKVTVGEIALRALEGARPPADRYLALVGDGRFRERMHRGVLEFSGDSFRGGGDRLADFYAHTLSPKITTERIERLCREAMADAKGDAAEERRLRLMTIDDERFFRAKTTAAWSGIAPDDPRLVEATLRIVDDADYQQYPEQHGGGFEWLDLMFLREAVQNRPRSYLPALRAMLAGDAVDRTKALYLFAELAPHGHEAVEAAFVALGDDLFDARLAAARLLAAHAPPSDRLAKAMVERILDSKDGKNLDMVAAAVEVFEKHPQHIGSQVSRLVEALGDLERTPEERGVGLRTCLAANTLARAGRDAKAALPALRRMAGSKVVDERDAAALAIAAIAPDDESVVPLLIDSYTAARERIQMPWVPESSNPETFVAALGRLETRTPRQVEFLIQTALAKPLIVCDPETAQRELAYVYEAPIAPEAAIALARMKSAARVVLPQLRAEVARRDFDIFDRPRQLALAVAVLRIDGRGQRADVAAVIEVLRTIPVEEITPSTADELIELAKTHPEIASEMRRRFLQTARSLRPFPEDLTYWRVDTWTLVTFARGVRAGIGSDPLCCRRAEDLLAAELRLEKLGRSDVEMLLAVLETLDDRSPRLARILRAAENHIDPETRWLTGAALKRIAANSPPRPEP